MAKQADLSSYFSTNLMESMSRIDSSENEMEGEGDSEVEEAEFDLDVPDTNHTVEMDPVVLVRTWPSC